MPGAAAAATTMIVPRIKVSPFVGQRPFMRANSSTCVSCAPRIPVVDPATRTHALHPAPRSARQFMTRDGGALQECWEIAVGFASCIRPFGACCAPGIMDISARAFSLAEGLNGPFGSPVFACAGKTDLHLVISRRPRRVGIDLAMSSRAPHRAVLWTRGRMTIRQLGSNRCASLRS